MSKKRIIFVLLYCDGFFCLSRNFKLQRIGDFRWLQRNYNFNYSATFIDELIILDISRKSRDINKFATLLYNLSENIFVPITAGGGIRSFEDAKVLFENGADKVCLNTSLIQCPHVSEKISSVYGQQSLVASIDFKHDHGDFKFFIDNGLIEVQYNIQELISFLDPLPFCEILLQSVDRDGTGTGFDLTLANTFRDQLSKPIILLGGAGHSDHLVEGLLHQSTDAVATAHLLNFVGDGLKLSREQAQRHSEVSLARWPLLSSTSFSTTKH
ncbi:HisA/HisF-related TIM barrel protein [Parasynechococcus marenigrum]|uniref:Putative imidazole glycerol phosphate synthase subunit hisF2 n=1 Tax=Parasynechococcus marenigrum (strain WH8102) TaxID=84588 RepID=HIS62_PARMW|nr:HisA/HisF-related TIM barrel protein [Parasynechococcus marenigrum]Q7U923.1 RecName: Full=Putative imidazole glycerol phosphate synthase subunit hisF2; AltName: Full=IGP synthase cyclase subunit; AltName: Full=IGP synthase subunit hisF2; AltName: Full=ImGP synthase subunit hisF2; Short=IGPS subunit hisF2 [Parasynechococcus marenigrum WH 8102]CAE06951.1 putative cyclase hisF [Parasynechococcus marenigrum WH 8102]